MLNHKKFWHFGRTNDDQVSELSTRQPLRLPQQRKNRMTTRILFLHGKPCDCNINKKESLSMKMTEKSLQKGMRFPRCLATVAPLMLLFATSIAQAATITASGDTYIRSSTTTTNYGSDIYMVANDNSANIRMAVFSFDISSAAGLTIDSAKLELDDVIGNYSGTFEVWGLLDADEDFNEATLTWANAGFVDGTDISTIDAAKAYGGVALGTFDNTANSVNTVFDVLSGTYVDFLNASADNDVTFVIVDPDAGGSGSGWATKESSVDLVPTLTLTAIPEPTALALMGLGTVVISIRRRRA